MRYMTRLVRRPIAHRLRRGNGRCPGAADGAPMACRHAGEVASLARLQSAGEVHAFRRASAVPGGGFPARSRSSASTSCVSPWITASGSAAATGRSSTRRRSRRSTRRSGGAQSTEFTSRSTFIAPPAIRSPPPPRRATSGPTPRRRRVCAEHWAMFARRYRGISSERLSFNLMNEPAQRRAEGLRGGGSQVGASDPP